VQKKMTNKLFTATIEKTGSKTVIPLPFDPNVVWGSRQRHHITGTVGGHKIRGPLSQVGEQFVLPLGDAWRRDTGLQAGDSVEVALSAEGPQAGQLAEDVTAALDTDPQARAFFESLATFYRNGFIKSIEGARRPETRAARIAEMMVLLQAGKKQK
jgi:hypothetical protein